MKNTAKKLMIVFVVFWLWLAINPHNRYFWFLENIILIVFLGIMLLVYRRMKFSSTTYILIFIFCILQTIGAHFVYSHVPIDWFTNFFGFERNHYDRIVHFAFGLLLAYPFKEFFMKTAKVKNAWVYITPILITLAAGALYELIEWLAAIFLDPRESMEFLGIQGDIWDGQKDMAVAFVGSCIAMGITWCKENFISR